MNWFHFNSQATHSFWKSSCALQAVSVRVRYWLTKIIMENCYDYLAASLHAYFIVFGIINLSRGNDQSSIHSPDICQLRMPYSRGSQQGAHECHGTCHVVSWCPRRVPGTFQPCEFVCQSIEGKEQERNNKEGKTPKFHSAAKRAITGGDR